MSKIKKMNKISMKLNTFFAIHFLITVYARKECIQKRIANADTECVCNATYCDDFPPLTKSVTGSAQVFESNKAGNRFKQIDLKFESTPVKSNVSKTINSNEKYQTILGFGGAFTDSTGQMLKQVNVSLANLLMESYFSQNGIEYTLGRIPIAGSDFSPRPYSYDDIDGDLELKHFSLTKEDTDWKIPYIQQAIKLSPHKIKLFGSPWSPPAWLKTNNKFNESGSIRGTMGGEYYQTWANYFVKFLEAYKSNGINLWGITVENEPVEGQNPKHSNNCLNFTSTTERDFVKLNLGPTFEKAGYNTSNFNLMVYDDNAPNLQEWSDTILADKDAAKYVSGIAYHWYGNNPMSGFPDKLLSDVHQKHPNYFLLNTEACHLDGAALGMWDHGEKYAYDIIRALNNWVVGWVEWNMALNMLAGPRWPNNTGEPVGFGGAINIDPKAGEAYKQPSFYTIGHFSKFIPPDSVRIGYTSDKAIDGLSILTIKRPDNQTVLVVLNANNEEVLLNINDSNKVLSNKISERTIQSYIWS